MKNLFSKVISFVAIIMLVAAVGITVSAYEYPDEGYWANEAIDAAIDNGLLRGKEDGKMHSEDNLTRAEMAAIMVRSFGATISAEVGHYVDLDPSAWYYADFAKAVQMRVFEGDGSGHMRPNDYITREEVFAVVARALVLNDTNYSALDKFNDKDQISKWAKGYMNILTRKSYVNGDNLGNANPKNNITRAEFAQLMHNIFRNYYSKADAYTGNTDSRSSMINVGNVTFKNVTVNGDLVIGDGNAQGTIRLENVNIKGRLLVRGSNRVELVNTTVGEMVVVNNYNTVVHFDNYRTEKVFDGIVENTKATFKQRTGGSSTPSYIITYDVDGGTPIDKDRAYRGREFTLPGATSTTKAGFVLKGWIVNGTEYAPGEKVSGITAATTVKAVWESIVITEYTITFDTDGGSEITPKTLTDGEDLVLPDANSTIKAGYTLDGWMVNGTKYAPGATVAGISADTTVKAVWTAETYDIIYDVDGGSVIPNGTATYGENFVLPGNNATSKTGFYLKGWIVNGTEYVPGATVAGITADTTIKAVWEAVTPSTKYGSYTVKFYQQNTDLTTYLHIAGDDTTVNNVVVGSFTYTADADKYVGFDINSSCVSITKDITENGMTIFEVRYDRETYAVEYNTDGGTSINAGKAYYGVNFTLPAVGTTTKTGYTLEGWIVNGTEYAPGATVSSITADTTAKAVWKANTYTVTFDENGGTDIPNGTATYGQEFTLPAVGSTTKTGYVLKGWIVNGTEYVPGTKVSGITADTTIKAVWTAETYEITYDVDGGSPINNGSATYGQDFTLPGVGTTTKTGYVLDGWMVNGAKYAPGATVSGIAADTTIKAVWELETYTVTYDVDGGTPIDNGTAKYGEDFVLPGNNSTSKTGYTLKGWMVNGTEYVPGATVTGINADTTAKAVWEEITPDTKYGSYKVQFYQQNTDLTTYQHIASDDITVNDVVVGSYTYTADANKYVGFDLNSNYVSITKDIIENDTTIFEVYYDREAYTVEYDVDGGTAMSDGTAYYGIDFTLPALGSTTKTGWILTGWEVNGTQYGLGATVSGIAADTTAKAIWTRETYTVTYDVDGGSPIDDDTATFGYGFTLPGANSTTKTGHILKGWIVNGTTYNPGTTVAGIAADTTIKAVWEVETYDVTFNTDGGSAIVPTTVKYGDDLTLPVVGSTTKTGYTLVGWMVKGTQYNPGATVSDITADTEVLAVWKLNEYTITYDVDGGSAIDDAKAYYGVDFTLPSIGSTTKTGHILKGWTINGTSYDLGATVSGITADTTVKAVWEAETYTVTYNVDGGSAIAPETIKYGEELVLPAVGDTTKDGYTLKGWNVNGTEYAPGATVTGITTNVTAKAVWEAEIPGVKYGSYVIKYYKQNDAGEYDYVAGDDEVGRVEVGTYTVSVNSNKYDGYVLNANNVYTMDIVEGQTTEFKVYYDIKPAGVEYNTVTFYYSTNVVGTTDVENGTTVPEAQFPDYMRTYKDGYVKDSTISSVYTTPYQHTVDYGWWYNKETDKWEEFTTETVVNSDMDVYLKISKFNTIVTLGSGEQFNFYAFYESDTRFIDTVKDILYKRGPLEALKVSGYWDKVRENGKVQKVLDEDDNIMMLSYMVKFATILGEENVEKFIVDSAKESFGNNTKLESAFVEYLESAVGSSDLEHVKEVKSLMVKAFEHVIDDDPTLVDELEALAHSVMEDPVAFEEITGYDYNSFTEAQREIIIDEVVVKLEAPSTERDEIVATLVDYLFTPAHQHELEDLVHYAMVFLNDHTDERDRLVDDIIEELYRADLDRLVDELINNEQFTINERITFVAEGMKNTLLRDYNYETLFGSKIPEKLEKVFEIYPEEKLIELYDYAMNNLIAQIDDAIAIAETGGTAKIDCGITPVVNIISDIYVPLYESYVKIIEGPVDDKIGDNFYYAENIYLQELMKLLDPEVWVQGSANPKPSDTTGYKIYDLDYYYDLMYKIYVLGDDAILWYYNNISEEKYIEVTENYEKLILKYVNIIADKIDLYVMEGEIPKVNEKVDDKISAAEKAIVEKYPELVKGLIDKYKGSDFFNKDYTDVDYDKVRDKVYEIFVRTLNLKTDEYFDLILSQEAIEDLENKVEDKIEDKLDGKLDGEYYTKIDDNTYEFEVNDYMVRFIRELKNTLY